MTRKDQIEAIIDVFDPVNKKIEDRVLPREACWV